ncbi:methionyl-tRNA formyltransferase [Geothermobacter hydrogeniphilus]|uniref:Formyl transferase n=1 Tax=Geothermobacter hydrogeniphilus TaxID=1969733 RepID=A0A1X0Y0Q7_9BACT|nr:formyltransferase family protein [Geothermobacter hydrogeniphilus]ORJ58770.1 formyl transferase [Geothermobacter hydrogeniphilus]
MRILIITQDEPFFLAENIDYLLRHLPDQSNVVGCCLFDASPFGRRESFVRKVVKTLYIFGPGFFLHYSVRFLANRFFAKKKLRNVLLLHGVSIIKLTHSINHPESIEILKSYDPDLLISIAGNQLFKKSVIELAPKGCLNLHTALLPKYRGLMPTFWVLKNDEKETGVSVFFVDEGIDSGPILVQDRIQVDNRSQQDLIRHTKKIGMDAIIKAVKLIDGDDYSLIENNDDEMTYYSFPNRKDVRAFLKSGKRFY